MGKPVFIVDTCSLSTTRRKQPNKNPITSKELKPRFKRFTTVVRCYQHIGEYYDSPGFEISTLGGSKLRKLPCAGWMDAEFDSSSVTRMIRLYEKTHTLAFFGYSILMAYIKISVWELRVEKNRTEEGLDSRSLRFGALLLQFDW